MDQGIAPPEKDGYVPISEHGIIGNMLSSALISKDGSVDWYCIPRFDSPSVFAAILDPQKGGRFQVRPAAEFESSQLYLPDTNVLQTTFENTAGRMTLTDFMPCFPDTGKITASPEIHREVACTRGHMEAELIFEPRLDYGRGDTLLNGSQYGVSASNHTQKMTLAGDATFEISEGRARALLRLEAGDRFWFVVSHEGNGPLPVLEYSSPDKYQKTKDYWERQAGGCSISGRWRDHLVRSYLALHLLIYLPTNAIVAAPTTSLPEAVGGERNWDYRYAWLRDTALALSAFGRLGHREEVDGFMDWLLTIRHKYGEKRQTLYSIGLDSHPQEEILSHLDGYRRSQPVRIGNAAYDQNQLDVFGEVIDTAYEYVRMGGHVSKEAWEVLAEYIDHACRHWPDPDSGIWEIRGERRHYFYSKLMCWVAIDRGRRLAEMLGYEGNWEYWNRNWQLVKDNLLTKGWNPQRKAFTQHYATGALDASNLFVSLYDFLPVSDEKVKSTISQITSELGAGNGLLYRYIADDGLKGKEGAFLWCSFWLARNYIRMGRLNDAVALYEGLLAHGNHLGLFSEMVDPDTGEALGNFPQALTHLAIIITGLELNGVLESAETAKQQ